MVSLLLAFAAWADSPSCQLTSYIPIDFGNIDGIHDLHDSGGNGAYRPALIAVASRPDNPKEPSEIRLYTQALQPTHRDWNSISDLHYAIVFHEGKWFREVHQGPDTYVKQELTASLPLAYQIDYGDDKPGGNATGRLVGFLVPEGNDLLICPGLARPGFPAKLDLALPRDEKNSIRPATAALNRHYQPDCSERSVAISVPAMQSGTDANLKLVVESRIGSSKKSKILLKLPKKGDIYYNKEMLSMGAEGRFLSDCNGVHPLGSANGNSEEEIKAVDQAM